MMMMMMMMMMKKIQRQLRGGTRENAETHTHSINISSSAGTDIIPFLARDISRYKC